MEEVTGVGCVSAFLSATVPLWEYVWRAPFGHELTRGFSLYIPAYYDHCDQRLRKHNLKYCQLRDLAKSRFLRRWSL